MQIHVLIVTKPNQPKPKQSCDDIVQVMLRMSGELILCNYDFYWNNLNPMTDVVLLS